MLVPELDVTALATSLRFYAEVLEFRILFERRWYRVDVAERGGRWQVKGPSEAGNRQFVLADPDGYLWRPFRDLGMRPMSSSDAVRDRAF